ncbi:hypothetical protein DC094_00210 [Pelagibaculum spongiae]|uniref:Uncharacterized protein n=1 Tax=Pelagibaculum spongiae TaxID=2080658 RepID=A0A2V1H0M1_9GAMM|nr:hypothetical protein DC094_00210 [Pelagibaculum spongiae]
MRTNAGTLFGQSQAQQDDREALRMHGKTVIIIFVRLFRFTNAKKPMNILTMDHTFYQIRSILIQIHRHP